MAYANSEAPLMGLSDALVYNRHKANSVPARKQLFAFTPWNSSTSGFSGSDTIKINVSGGDAVRDSADPAHCARPRHRRHPQTSRQDGGKPLHEVRALSPDPPTRRHRLAPDGLGEAERFTEKAHVVFRRHSHNNASLLPAPEATARRGAIESLLHARGAAQCGRLVR